MYHCWSFRFALFMTFNVVSRTIAFICVWDSFKYKHLFIGITYFFVIFIHINKTEGSYMKFYQKQVHVSTNPGIFGIHFFTRVREEVRNISGPLIFQISVYLGVWWYCPCGKCSKCLLPSPPKNPKSASWSYLIPWKPKWIWDGARSEQPMMMKLHTEVLKPGQTFFMTTWEWSWDLLAWR